MDKKNVFSYYSHFYLKLKSHVFEQETPREKSLKSTHLGTHL